MLSVQTSLQSVSRVPTSTIMAATAGDILLAGGNSPGVLREAAEPLGAETAESLGAGSSTPRQLISINPDRLYICICVCVPGNLE